MCASARPCRIPTALKNLENFFVAGHPSRTRELSPTGRSCLSGAATEEFRPGWVWLFVSCGAGFEFTKSLIWGSVACYTKRESFVDRCHRHFQRGDSLGVSVQILEGNLWKAK